MKLIKYILLTIIFGALLFIGTSVYAGGCCYKSFSTVNGIAGRQDAEINASFVDPRNSSYSVLANQKMAIHIRSPHSEQSCWLLSEYTDADGHVEARCRSAVPGSISVYFSAPELDSQTNDAISYVPKQIYFDADPNAPAATSTPAVMPTHVVVSPTQPVVEPTVMPTQSDEKTEMLQKRVAELEQEVQEQKEQVNFLTTLVHKLFDVLSGIFH